MDTTTQTTLSRVPETATQEGEILLRWSWVEWAVWTPRMLTALEQGVKGDVWFSLIDKVFSERNLRAAFCKVAANDGAPGVTTFPELDGWVRGRLRSVLRKRQGRSGRGRGLDHQRWPNKFFVKQGLFNLTTAHALAVQSSRR